MDLLTVDEVAERLRVSKGAVYRLVKRLPFAVKVGGAIRIPSSDLEDWLRAGGDAWPISTSEAESGGSKAETLTAPGTESRPGKPTEKPPSESNAKSSWNMRYRLKSERYR